MREQFVLEMIKFRRTERVYPFIVFTKCVCFFLKMYSNLSNILGWYLSMISFRLEGNRGGLCLLHPKNISSWVSRWQAKFFDYPNYCYGFLVSNKSTQIWAYSSRRIILLKFYKYLVNASFVTPNLHYLLSHKYANYSNHDLKNSNHRLRIWIIEMHQINLQNIIAILQMLKYSFD